MTDEKAPKVGYMNPPKHTQFKKGRSGNPRGRPRKRDDLNTVLQRVLNRKVRVKDLDGSMPIADALMWNLRNLALQGDKQAYALQRRILTEAGHDAPDPRPDIDKRKLFRKVGKLLKQELDKQENSDEG